MSLVVLLVYCYRGYQRARRRLLGIKRGGGMVGEEDEQIELMPARFSIDGGELCSSPSMSTGAAPSTRSSRPRCVCGCCGREAPAVVGASRV